MLFQIYKGKTFNYINKFASATVYENQTTMSVLSFAVICLKGSEKEVGIAYCIIVIVRSLQNSHMVFLQFQLSLKSLNRHETFPASPELNPSRGIGEIVIWFDYYSACAVQCFTTLKLSFIAITLISCGQE